MNRTHIARKVTYLLSLLDLHLEKLVHSFLVVQRIHDSQVDDSTQVDEVRLGAVLNPCLVFDG